MFNWNEKEKEKEMKKKNEKHEKSVKKKEILKRFGSILLKMAWKYAFNHKL